MIEDPDAKRLATFEALGSLMAAKDAVEAAGSSFPDRLGGRLG